MEDGMLDEMDNMEYINNLAAVLQEYTANSVLWI